MKFEPSSISGYLAQRGPDANSAISIEFGALHLNLMHGLLDISGSLEIQPIYSCNKRYILAFNGEIYNLPPGFRSDTAYLISLIDKFGHRFAHELDDIEGTILLVDLVEFKIYLYSDPFATKPMFFTNNSYTGELYISSSPKKIEEVAFGKASIAHPNSIYVFSPFDLEKIICISPIRKLSPKKYSFSNWEKEFLNSVDKRFSHGAGSKPIVPLSSGYDSGAIALALDLLGIKFDSISILGNEDISVINDRILHKTGGKHYTINNLNKREIKFYRENFSRSIGDGYLMSHADDKYGPRKMIDDGGLIALSRIADFSKRAGYNVLISGSGGDELMTDYGYSEKKIYYHSEFGGKFPVNLGDIFPWKKFFYDTQRSYLEKEEFILGIYGMEGRYPYLNWLLNEVAISESGINRNNTYKSLQTEFFIKHKYPFVKNKVGFSPGKVNIVKKIISDLFSKSNF